MGAPEDFPGDAAVFIQLLRRDHVLVGGDLEDGIGGGIDDQIPGGHMFVAEDVDDLGAGPGGVGQHAPAGFFPEGREDLFREALGIEGEGLRRDEPRQFPVAGGGILAPGGLRHAPVGGSGPAGLWQAVHAVDPAQTQADEIGDMELRRAGAGPQGAGAGVSEGVGVRQGAHAEGV